MNNKGISILTSFKKRWQSLLLMEALLYAFGAGMFAYFISLDVLLACGIFIVIGLLAAMFIKPWKPDLNASSSFIDSRIPTAEYSSGLLLQDPSTLSDLAKLQQTKIASILKPSIQALKPPTNVKRSLILSVSLIAIGMLGYMLDLSQYFDSGSVPTAPGNAIIFKTKDSIQTAYEPPRLLNQSVTVSYPSYTGRQSFSSSKMDIRVLAGSRVTWKLQFDKEVTEVFLESIGNEHALSLRDEQYTRSNVLNTSGFYNFKFGDSLGNTYTSDLYAIEVFHDNSPDVEIKGIKQFSSFNHDEEKKIRFNGLINDDFGIADAYIIATVSKGSGESVKFREEQLRFDNTLNKGSRAMNLAKTIDLGDLEMEPGDELYFYVEASDYKQPVKNIARSETYFATIKDTVSYGFGVEGTLGVNRMPDYFRSQRQLIIDTEKLISEKKNLTAEEFKFQSNELGFDQKALRLKYGEFMGVETDSGLDIEQESPVEEAEEHDEDEDPLAEYTHDHDGDNEHNLVPSEDQENEQSSKNPLQEFMHDHGDAEMATLFEESLKVKMHKAMAQMWDAELYLRLYEPKKSLPYQYRALKYIQDIKNHARIYVHRIGFDPPPIKEDKRLSGKLDGISSYRKTQDLKQNDDFKHMRASITLLENLLDQEAKPSLDNIKLLEKAANELSVLAIDSPGEHLRTLQQLKRVIDGLDSSASTFKEVQGGLLEAIPKDDVTLSKTNGFLNDIDRLLLKELEIDD